MSKPNWMSQPIVLQACTAEERAIIEAAQAYVASVRRVEATIRTEGVADVPRSVVDDAAQGYDALQAAVDAAAEAQP